MHCLFRSRSQIVRILVVLIAFVSLPTLSQAASAVKCVGQPPATQLCEINVNGLERSFYIHVPAQMPSGRSLPLVLVFHGGGQNGARIEQITGFDQYADSLGFIAVYPNGVDRHWNDGRSTIQNPADDIGFVKQLITTIEGGYAIDRSRIYATGASNGGIFTERVGCDLSDQLGAIAPVIGTLAADYQASCRPKRPIAVLQIDGTTDPVMPYNGGEVAHTSTAGEGGVVLSVAATVQFWAGVDGCRTVESPTTLPPIAPSDGTQIIRSGYEDCRAREKVVLLSVVNGGHAWPGSTESNPAFGRDSQQLDATRAIIEFFAFHPR